MRDLIDLVEAFTAVHPVRWNKESASKHTKEMEWAVAYINGKRVQIEFFIAKDKSVGVVFSVDQAEEKTGGGDAFSIFATVIAAIQEFLSRHPEVVEIDFDATVQEPSRVKLYRTMVRTLAKSEWSVNEKPIENNQTIKFILRRIDNT